MVLFFFFNELSKNYAALFHLDEKLMPFFVIPKFLVPFLISFFSESFFIYLNLVVEGCQFRDTYIYVCVWSCISVLKFWFFVVYFF